MLYTAKSGDGQSIWLMDSEGNDPRQLTPGGHIDSQPTVSADGRFAVFQSRRDGETDIWRIELDSGEVRPLTSGGENFDPDVSPDGRLTVYASKGIRRVSSDGGDPVTLTDFTASVPRYSPDGTMIAFEFENEPGKSQLGIMGADGERPYKDFRSAANS